MHCVVPSGGLSPDHARWIAGRSKFFLPVRILSRVFRGKFLDYLQQAFARGELEFHGRLKPLTDPAAFGRRLDRSVRHEWVVYAKPPFGGPQQVLKYLARYTHRVAIANSRLLGVQDGQVTFRWKDYAGGSQQRTMTLAATEFLRRFLQHVLPAGLMRIRHYGFMANRFRQEKLQRCRRLLGVSAPAAAPDQSLTGETPAAEPIPAAVCPACGQAALRITFTLERSHRAARGPVRFRSVPESCNSS